MHRIRNAVRYRDQLVYSAPAKPLPVRLRPAVAELRSATSDNVTDIGPLRGESGATAMIGRLRSGQLVIYAYLGDDLIGHAACHRPESLPRTVNGYLKLAQGQALIHACFVDPNHRGKGVMAELLREAARVIRTEFPSCTVLIDTRYSNFSSRRGIEKAGFNFEFRLRAIQVLRRPLFSVRTYAR